MTYTAWITTDASCLDVDGLCDVVVLANDSDGVSTGDPLWRAVTTIPSKPSDERDDEDVIRRSLDLLAAAGWQTEGDVESVPTGYIVNVTKS